MFARTIDALIERAVFLGGQDGRVGTGTRHETADVFREANAAYRMLIDRIEQLGFDWYRDSTNPASLPAADADFGWIVVPWATTYKSVVGVDVNCGGGPDGWRALKFAAWTQRHSFAGIGAPTHYTVRNVSDADGAGEFYLLPGRGASGQYVVHFTEERADLLTTESFVYPNASCEDWHAADLAFRLCGPRDGDTEGRVRALLAMKGEAERTMQVLARETVPDSTSVEMRRVPRRRVGW